MDHDKISSIVDNLSDEELGQLTASMPWQNPYTGGEARVVDEDGFEVGFSSSDATLANFGDMQREIWRKFVNNPQINSYIRDYMGRLTGRKFNMGSDHPDVAEKMKEIIIDPRNSLYRNMSKFVARSEIEGELKLCLTVHSDGFIEIDFMDPSTLSSSGTGDSGIYFHPVKQTFPLWYQFDIEGTTTVTNKKVVIPSINIAYFPSLKTSYKLFDDLLAKNLQGSRTKSRKYAKIGGFKRFIVEWDKGFLTPRNVSHIRTTIIWINHYENLKKWEIDHKRSSGAYLWVAYMEDPKAFRTWLKMTDDQKKATGLMASKTPGGTLILPPGVKLECKNPNLPSISDADTDIMNMVVSGLNTPEDMVTGVTKGSTFSGVKASRGPQADRDSNQIEYFDRFLQYDFWRPIFLLSSKVSSFSYTYKIKEAVDFKNKEPVFKPVKKEAWELVNIEYPVSAIGDIDSVASAVLGSKHGPLTETLGISREDTAEMLGLGNYRNRRLRTATEEETYPELMNSFEIESQLEGGGEVQQNPNQPVQPKPAPAKPAPAKPQPKKTDPKKEDK